MITGRVRHLACIRRKF